jgi:hypothetical protein
MPRQARLDAPGLLQHVMARGIERRDIFRDDEDRNSFLARLGLDPEPFSPPFTHRAYPAQQGDAPPHDRIRSHLQ